MTETRNFDIEKKMSSRRHFLDIIRSHIYSAKFEKYMEKGFRPRANPRTARLVAIRDSILNGYVSTAIKLFDNVSKHNDPITNDNSLVLSINTDVEELTLEAFLKKHFEETKRSFCNYAEEHLYKKITSPGFVGLPQSKHKITLEEFIQISLHSANPKLTDPELQTDLNWLKSVYLLNKYNPHALVESVLIEKLTELKPIFSKWICLSKGGPVIETSKIINSDDIEFPEDFILFRDSTDKPVLPKTAEGLSALLEFCRQLIFANIGNEKRNVYIFEEGNH